MAVALRMMCLASGMVVLVSGCVATTEAQNQGDVAARVGDTVVTLGDVEEAWNENDPGGRLRALQDLYETRLRVLDLVVGDHLIDREAQERGVDREELLAQELPSRTVPVTDADVERIYERNRDRFAGQTLDEMRSEIRTALEQQRPNEALREFMRELRMAAEDVVVTLDPPRQDVETLADDPSKGPADALVVIVEFSDFECPYCQRASDTMAELYDRYPDDIRLVYKDFPLPSHPNAFKAAEAGNCANDQGKFWEFHDKLFATQDALDVESLKAYAGELGLDASAFEACLDEGRHAETVSQDLTIGRSYGASSTPTLFINGRPVFGAMPFDLFDNIIREEIAAAQR